MKNKDSINNYFEQPMLMNMNRATFENLLFGLAVALAIILRFSNLGSAPLSDSEANLALQALHLAQEGGAVQITSNQPAYLILTNGLFSLFGSSNFGARFWSALAGSLLVLIPWLMSRTAWGQRINRPTWIIMAYGLALTPGLVATSRLADSQMMALSFCGLSIALLMCRKPILAGIAAGAAFTCGLVVLNGIIIIGLGWLLASRLPGSSNQKAEADSNPQPDVSVQFNRKEIRQLFFAAIITIILLSSAFFRSPAGLASWFETLPEYLSSWTRTSDVPILRILVALLIYQPIAVIFSIPGALRGLISPTTNTEEHLFIRTSLSWVLIGLVIILIYPARQVVDVVWVLVPLIALASWEVSHYLPEGKVHPVSILHALLLITLMGLLWYSLASISRIPAEDQERTARWIVVVGVFTFGALTTVLIQLGWSWNVAKFGLVWGVLGGLLLFSISMLWGSAYTRANQPQELWASPPTIGQADLLLKTIQDLSWRNTGRPDSLDIISEVSSPSMRWLLRNFENVQFTSKLEPQALPSILITSQEQTSPSLIASYRGQDFIWTTAPGWDGALPGDLTGWLTFRRAPLEQQSIILWARSDRFPGGTLVLPSTEAPTIPEEDLLEYPDLP